MKEYKSLTILVDWKTKLDDQLNMISKDGWEAKEILSKNISSNEIGNVFILFERDISLKDNSGYDEWYNKYVNK